MKKAALVEKMVRKEMSQSQEAERGPWGVTVHGECGVVIVVQGDPVSAP